MSHSVTNKISYAHSEDIEQHLTSLISAFNVHKVQSFPLDICWTPRPGDDMVT